MYRYDEFDAAFVRERTAQFADQVARRLTGEINEDQFRPLRLMNGLYLQLHAYMLRIAIPYGTLSSRQMHMLAHIARTYDRNYGHFTTRQNIQFNWPKLRDSLSGPNSETPASTGLAVANADASSSAPAEASTAEATPAIAPAAADANVPHN